MNVLLAQVISLKQYGSSAVLEGRPFKRKILRIAMDAEGLMQMCREQGVPPLVGTRSPATRLALSVTRYHVWIYWGELMTSAMSCL